MKAYQQAWKHITVVPAVNFDGKRYTFANVNSDGKGITAAAGEVAIGVIQEPNNIDEPAQVMAQGVSFIILGGTVAAGAQVEVGADGKAIALATGVPVGICLVGGVADDIGSVLLK